MIFPGLEKVFFIFQVSMIFPEARDPGSDIQLCDRTGQTRSTYIGLCSCAMISPKYISELIPGQYLAELCWDCNDIKVVDMVTNEVHKAYPGSSLFKKYVKLWAMCSGPGEGSLLVWDDESYSVIQLQWNEGQKQLNEVRQVKVPGEWVPGRKVWYVCYLPHTDLVILSRGGGELEAVKLQGGQPPVWQLKGTVLEKEIDPYGVSCDSEGRVYVADGGNRRLLLFNGYTGQVIQQLLQDTGLGTIYNVCCLSNPHQLLVKHRPPPDKTRTLSLYNVTSL